MVLVLIAYYLIAANITFATISLGIVRMDMRVVLRATMTALVSMLCPIAGYLWHGKWWWLFAGLTLSMANLAMTRSESKKKPTPSEGEAT